MPIKYGIVGGFTIDNVINADGKIALHQCGGNAFYASAGARLWTDSIGVVARIGEDYPQQWLQRLGDVGIDVSGVRKIPGPHFIEGSMLYSRRGDRKGWSPKEFLNKEQLGMLPEEMKNGFPTQDPSVSDLAQRTFAPDPEDIPVEYLDAKAFHLSPRYYYKHRASLDLLKRDGLTIFLDPGIWYMRERDEEKIFALFKDVDVVLPSEVEARALFGDEQDLEDMARNLAAFGPKVVAIKLGVDGCLVYDKSKDQIFRVPVYPANVVDPTGAGDSFCGGFMVGYTETNDPLLAAVHGTVSASFIVEGFGAGYALDISKDEADSRLQKVLSVVTEK